MNPNAAGIHDKKLALILKRIKWRVKARWERRRLKRAGGGSKLGSVTGKTRGKR